MLLLEIKPRHVAVSRLSVYRCRKTWFQKRKERCTKFNGLQALDKATAGDHTNVFQYIVNTTLLYLKSTWQRARNATYMPHSQQRKVESGKEMQRRTQLLLDVYSSKIGENGWKITERWMTEAKGTCVFCRRSEVPSKVRKRKCKRCSI